MLPNRFLARSAAVAVTGGAAATAYALWEARQYTLREVTVPVLLPGQAPLRVLQVSDLHITPDQEAKREWVRGLAALEPDLVINTGDNLSHTRAVPFAVEALRPLMEFPGAFVFGSNDYYAPGFRNPIGYLLPDNGQRATNKPTLPWWELRDAFLDASWVDLTNRRQSLAVGGVEIAFAGVDDAHLSLDDLTSVKGPADATADLRLAVTHAPYLRVLDQFAEDGYDAIIAGHTHGGQVCLPWVGALTTNCDLEPARAKGLHRHPAQSLPGDPGSSWLHVSAGLGTNRFIRLRVACRPEATLMTLVPRL